ncbi:MAG: hypothetical protein GC192_17670 [Bacteroidetes bacterium]|nr:hypothetical protein [Bacteroidota bacterium]
MKKAIENFSEKYSFIKQCMLQMETPNEDILIYTGIFTLKCNKSEFEIMGKICFEWFPNSRPKFSGEVVNITFESFMKLGVDEKLCLFINNLFFGNCFITSKSSDGKIEGVLSSDVVKGDRTIVVDKICFSIPNFREFLGELIEIKEGTIGRNRIGFEDKSFQIVLDKRHKFSDYNNQLMSKGGYMVLYCGEITKKSGGISYEESKEILYAFSTFLSFLNGRRCSAIFRHGMFETELVWCDYSGYFIDEYKSVSSWPPKFSIEGLNEMWAVFKELWDNENDRDFLTTSIHWYVEANGNSGFIEGSILMTQIALELIYNWFIVEQKKLILGKDSENIQAANKIRLLLSQLEMSNEVPIGLNRLKKYLIDNKLKIDAPEIFVQIRNAIVHSQSEQRKKISKIPDMVKYESLQLGIMYVELALLKILRYEGKFHDRCSGVFHSGGEVFVPWSKNSIVDKIA